MSAGEAVRIDLDALRAEFAASPGAGRLQPLGLGRERRSFFLGSWVEPELVAKITYSTWTADSLLRHTAYVGLRKDKAADQVRREPLG